ncbi:hypothetical protein EJB05_12934 [Eragrostis curvula]|uniref:Major facilitator superfamily (MFS) profile domain-containing protein n=1 Tax=Eragrostis curvula TaxID=38414 RepID=A0A5J9VV45_9POAL|nr:hypothetical protein EJB05_12934 [Eragrostis curvula]
MYYSPTIVQLAGFASNSTAMALSLVTSGLNAVGSVVSMFFVDKAGRRKLMLLSLAGIVACLAMLSGVFYAVDSHAPDVGADETAFFGANATCPEFGRASATFGAEKWTCTHCLKAPSECGFCANTQKEHDRHNHITDHFTGQTMIACSCFPGVPGDVGDGATNMPASGTGRASRVVHAGCPSSFGWLALVALGAYIVSYSPGMGSVPWLINSEVYPLRFRGVCGGIAAVANWSSNLLVTQTFLSLTQALGTAGTFLLFCGVSAASFLLLFLLVPETKGLQFEEVEQMLASKDYKPWKKYNPTNHSRESNGNTPTKG